MLKLVMLSVVVASCYGKSLPTYVTKCSEKDPKMNQYIKEQCNNMIPKIRAGDKERHIPPIGEFKFDKITMEIGAMHLEMVRGKVYGLEATNIENVEFDTGAHTFHLAGFIPHVTIKCDYVTSGKLLFLVVEGKGPLDVYIEGASFDMKIELENLEHNSKKRISYVSSDLDYSFKNASFNLGNLFNGNKKLGDPVNKLINDDPQALNREFKPAFVGMLNALIQSIIKPLLREYNYDDIINE